MPTTRAAPRRRPTKAAQERTARNADAVSRVQKSLEAAQADLATLRGDLGRGAGELRRDVARMLRDARRDVARMSRLVRRDLERLQQDLGGAAGRASTPGRAGARARAARPRPARSARSARRSAA